MYDTPFPDSLIGLDLGPAQDHTGLAVLEQHLGEGQFHYAVRHLHRWPPGTPYAGIVADVEQMLETPGLRGCPLVVDQTGVGRAVAALFQDVPAGLLRRVVVTAGHAAHHDPEGFTGVPKRELVGVMQILLQGRRLKVAAGLPLSETLTRELALFRARIANAAGDAYPTDWRERAHDDLVLAVGLAVWHGERTPPRDDGEPLVLARGRTGSWRCGFGELRGGE